LLKEFTIRPIVLDEIDAVAGFISRGYCDDIFFHWCVESDEDRHSIVTDYYKVYLLAEGCVAHVAQSESNEIIGATVWLPHDVDAGIYDDIEKVTGKYADRFREVADKSHENEPKDMAFYQLVAVVTEKSKRSGGTGTALLKYHLDILDEKGIATYLEASTPYYGKGLYGKFGYAQYGELMHFSDTAVLYPLWRPAGFKK